LPERERLGLLAVRADLENRFEDRRRLLDQVAEANPLDKEAVFLAGDARYEVGDFRGSIPYFLRALALDPDYFNATGHLVTALVNSGHVGQHLDWVVRRAATSSDPREIRGMATCLLTVGREDEAMAAFRRADALDGRPWPPRLLMLRLAASGRAAEAEVDVRAALAGLSTEVRERHATHVKVLSLVLGEVLAAQGRLREAEAHLMALELPPVSALGIGVSLGAAARSNELVAAAVRDAEARGFADDLGFAWGAAVATAAAGDRATAARFAGVFLLRSSTLDREPGERAFTEAVAAWGSGNGDLAESRLSGMRSTVHDELLSNALRGRMALERRDWSAAAAALEQARAQQGIPAFSYGWRAWFLPGILHSLALSYEQLGDLAKARERNDEMLRRWEKADPDLPLLLEAKALKARLEAR
jgi:tetratricopeptide (TPR) repeat protein